MDFSPDFIWLLDAEFISGVKTIIKDNEKLSKLKELNDKKYI